MFGSFMSHRSDTETKPRALSLLSHNQLVRVALSVYTIWVRCWDASWEEFSVIGRIHPGQENFRTDFFMSSCRIGRLKGMVVVRLVLVLKPSLPELKHRIRRVLG